MFLRPHIETYRRQYVAAEKEYYEHDMCPTLKRLANISRVGKDIFLLISLHNI